MASTAAGTTVRPLGAGDWDGWKPLWDGYLRFYRAQLDDSITEVTFRRLCERSDGLQGFLAVDDGGAALGLAHIVIHPSTWTDRSYCYLEDLFVDRRARGGSAAADLIAAVYEAADAAGAARVYWHTQEYNGAARSLYDQVGHRTSFVVYER
ncbi:MAG TPA: GNAT family N-acetyltransferase [Solirubrobacteraceae bacterium]